MNVSVKSLRIYTWNLGLDKSAENHKQKYLSFSEHFFPYWAAVNAKIVYVCSEHSLHGIHELKCPPNAHRYILQSLQGTHDSQIQQTLGLS